MTAKKIRPSRIVKGITNTILNKNSTSSIDRFNTCKNCEHYKKGSTLKGVCNLCGCVTKFKSNVIQEHCPINKWSDVKYLKSKGISVVNLSTDKGQLEIVDKGFIFKFNDLSVNADASIDLLLVNNRSLEMSTNLNLERIIIRPICGCTISSNHPKTLDEGDNFKFTITYDSTRIGGFNKVILIQANGESLFNLTINGIIK